MRKIAIIFLLISLNMCFGCSKEPSHRDGSFEYPQDMFLLRNKKIIFSYHSYLGGLTNFVLIYLFLKSMHFSVIYKQTSEYDSVKK